MFKKTDELAQLKAQHEQLKAAMSEGVGKEMELSWHHTPRRLREGLNCAHVAAAATLRLLLDKGVVTEQEYWRYLVAEMAAEVKAYEERLSEALGKKVSLS